MEPQRRLAVGERSGYALAKAELAALDRATATAALGAPGRRRLEDVRHAATIPVAGRPGMRVISPVFLGQ
jgi:hypothetical protein